MNPETPADPLPGSVNVTILDVYSDSEIWIGAYQFQNPNIRGGSASTGTQGMPLRVTGEYLANTTRVLFDNLDVSFSPVSDGLIVTVPPHADGQVTVIASDEYQNESSFLFTYQNPTLSIQNLSGPQRSATQIIGQYLQNTSQITFDGTSAPFDPSPTLINVSVPDGTGNASVVVEDLYGNKLYTRFQYKNPNASYVLPDNGPKNMPVTIFGSYLQDIVSVNFGMSTLYPIPTENSISLTVPNSFGSEFILTDRYTNTTQVSFTYMYTLLYEIRNELNQTDNMGTQNKVIYIYGNYLINTSRVLFGNTPASFQYLFNEGTESESLEVTVPPSEGTVSLRVIDQYLNEVQLPYVYQNSSVHSFSPATGTVGWPLTLYGDYLQDSTILYNGEEWNPIKTQNTVTATVRSGSGNVSFQITDAYGNWIPFSGVFQYRNPRLTALSASTGRAGRTLTLSGENLSNTSRVSVGTTVYPLSVLETSVQIQVPDYHGRVTVIAYDRYDASCEIGPFYAMGQEPTLDSINPSRGPNYSPVTLVGTNLSYTSRLYLGQNLSFQKTDSTLTFNASMNASMNDSTEPMLLEIYDEAGEVQTIPFTYINPKLEEVFPSEGPNQVPVILRGKYLNRTTIVYVQNVSVPFVPGDQVTLTMPILSASNVSIVLVDDLGNRTSGNFLYKNSELFTPSAEPQRKTIRLYGKNLSNTSTVTFDGQPVSFVSADDYLEVRVVDGNVSTTIVATDHLLNSINTILYYQNPSATTIVPGEGTFRVPLTLSGVNLSNTSSIRFGGINVSFVNVSGSLRVFVPDSSGNVSVVVTDPYTNAIEYPFVYKNPLLYDPPGEPQRKIIRLLGQNLSNTSTVTFDGRPVSFVPTANSLEVTVPDGNISTRIVVTDQWSNQVSVTMSYQNPSATAIQPREGPYGMPLILSGKYLNNTSTVRFGEVDASFTQVGEDLRLTIPISSTVLGNVSVIVTDHYTNVTSIGFTYQNMVLQSLNPSSGPQRRYVEIRGTHLSNTSTLLFGQYNVSFDRIEGGLRVKVPDQEGEVTVHAIDLYGNNVSAKYLYRNPRLSVITPSAGRTNRYTRFYGENLGETESIFFGDREGVLETATLSDGSMNVVIPENYGNVSVYVKDPYGNVTYWDQSFLCLGGNASVYGIFPNRGTTQTKINLSGENLSFTNTVTIGNNASFTIESSENLLVKAPLGTGPQHVIVSDILGEDVVYMGTFLYENPKITSINPSTGTTNTVVNISGEHLQNTSSLLFGGVPIPMANLSFLVPPGSGTANVELLDRLDNVAALDGVFTYHNPNVSRLEPAEGPKHSTLRIHGQYLWNTSDVRFGEANASILGYTTDWIDVEVPPGSTTVMVYVRDRLENTFPFNAFIYRNPYFGSIDPMEGPLNTSVQLYGLNLANTSKVIFGNIDVSYVIHSETRLEVLAPNTSGSAAIEIIDRYQNSVSYSSYLYRNPSITQILPDAGPKRSKVNVIGVNLSNTSYVRFGNLNASFVRQDNGLLLTVPDGSNVSVALSIVDTVGNVVTTSFRYLNPEFSSVDLTEGPQRTMITVYGINLSNTSTVRFNGLLNETNVSSVNASFSLFEEGLYITVPDANARAVTVIITDLFTNNISFDFKYLNPRVYSLNPSYGIAYTNVSVIGENLSNCVPFFNVSGEWVEAEFIGNILSMLPGEGTTTVLFKDPLGNETSGLFTYQNLSITSIHPSSGPKNSPMVIRGEWLENTSYVYFLTTSDFGIYETEIDFEIKNSEIHFRIPDSIGPIYVYDAYFNYASFDFDFIYQNPKITYVLPTVAPTNSEISVYGRYLQNTSQVTFDGINASFSRISTGLSVIVPQIPSNFSDPSGNSSSVPNASNSSNASTRVVVTDLYENRDEFTFNYQNPRLFTMSPLEGVEGSTITLGGEYLQNTSYVLFGPWNATILDRTVSTIIVSAPLVLENVSVTSIDVYGNRSTVPNSFIPLPFIRSSTCFPAGTTVTTDQGLVEIQKLIVGTHTIEGRAIQAVTCTLSMDDTLVVIEKDALRKNKPTLDTLISRKHKIYYKGEMISAQRLVGRKGIYFVPYTGILLYNVVLNPQGKMNVHGMLCETLDPSNPIAPYFNRPIE